LYLYVKARRKEELEGLVLPLFDKFGFALDEISYEYLIELYSQYHEYSTVYRLYALIKGRSDL
jgi:hypothetical protein